MVITPATATAALTTGWREIGALLAHKGYRLHAVNSCVFGFVLDYSDGERQYRQRITGPEAFARWYAELAPAGSGEE